MHPEKKISTPYIHALAPRIVEYLYTEKSQQMTSDAELSFTLECIATVENLISLVEPSDSKIINNFVIKFRNFKAEKKLNNTKTNTVFLKISRRSGNLIQGTITENCVALLIFVKIIY